MIDNPNQSWSYREKFYDAIKENIFQIVQKMGLINEKQAQKVDDSCG